MMIYATSDGYPITHPMRMRGWNMWSLVIRQRRLRQYDESQSLVKNALTTVPILALRIIIALRYSHALPPFISAKSFYY